jgi:hypothetical protein
MSNRIGGTELRDLELSLNDLEPQQDVKGGTHHPIVINLSLGDGTLNGPTSPDRPLIKARAK